MQLAPLPLALERTWECDILSQKQMTNPLLDLGCGEGIFTHILFNDQLETGLDPQARELQRAKEFGTHHEYLQCFGSQIPKPDGHYQTILSNSVLEHIPDLEPVLKEAHRVLASNGNFYITVPTNYFDEYSLIYRSLSFLGLKDLALKYKKFFNNFWAHYHYYTIPEWTKLLNKNGFKVIESQQYCTKFQGTLNDVLAPFSLFAFVQKKFFNKWFVVPGLRKPFAFILSILFKKASLTPKSIKTGGIVFFHLRKMA